MLNFFKKKNNLKEEESFANFPNIGGLMVSKMVVNENIKPHFMYREKRTRPEDSGWRIFTGFETEEYNDNSNNIGIYNPSTILQIDPSIKDLLLKGVGSVYERTENGAWYRVTDFNLEDDYLTTHQLTEEWTIEINNLFERSIEKDGTLYYTTGDKSIRMTIWNADKSREELYAQHSADIENRDQTKAKTLEKFEFSDNQVLRIGYLIEENDEVKTYMVLYGFSVIDKQVVQLAIYFDEKNDLDWATHTWKNIKYQPGQTP